MITRDLTYNQLNTQGIFFVTRLRKNARYRVTERRSVRKSKGLTSDQTIELAGAKAANCPVALRRIGFKDTGSSTFHVDSRIFPAGLAIR